MTYRFAFTSQQNTTASTEESDFETRLDHRNLCVEIKWYPSNWPNGNLVLVVGGQDNETIEVYMRCCENEKQPVRILSCPVGELLEALDEFFTDLNDPSRNTSKILNLDRQPTPSVPEPLENEIRKAFERIHRSLIRGEVLRAPNLRRL